MFIPTLIDPAAIPQTDFADHGADQGTDRIQRALARRIEGCAERRRLAALAPDPDMAFLEWCHEIRRGDTLKRALIQHRNR